METKIACKQLNLFALDMGSNPEISFCFFFFWLETRRWDLPFGKFIKASSVENSDGCIEQVESRSYYI